MRRSRWISIFKLNQRFLKSKCPLKGIEFYNHSLVWIHFGSLTNLPKEKLERPCKMHLLYMLVHMRSSWRFINPAKCGKLLFSKMMVKLKKTCIKYGTKACCGTRGHCIFSPQVFCGRSKKLNNIVVTTLACTDPSSYVSWVRLNSQHWCCKDLYSQWILSGKYFQPSFPLSTLCDLQPLGWT